MSKYFRVIGFLNIIDFSLGFLCLLIRFIIVCHALDPFSIVIYIIFLLALLIVGPALGLLFISHSAILETKTVSNEIGSNELCSSHIDITKISEPTPIPENQKTYHAGDKVIINQNFGDAKEGEEGIVIEETKLFTKVDFGHAKVLVPTKMLTKK